MAPDEVPVSPSLRGSTKRLLDLYKEGRASALELLLQREIPLLRSWAHGRLPKWARSMVDTADLIQGALTRSLPHLNKFEPRREKALQAYLRSAVANQIKDELRRFGRAPLEQMAEHHDIADPAPSASEELIDRDNQRRFVEALQRLTESDRAAVVARLELGYSYEQIALMLDKRSANTARMTVTRAVARLIEEMTDPARS
jgi:RNA polymerase sigma factor (sigma-70 family)